MTDVQPADDAAIPTAPPGYLLVPVDPPPRSKRLGVLALCLAAGTVGASVIVSVIVGLGAVPFTVQTDGGFHYFLNANSSNHTEAALAVLGLVQAVAGSVLGTLALILGIVATVQKRGRAFGVVAIVIAALGPAVSFGVTLGVLGANLH